MSQHRLSRVQLVNWGTFDGAWSFRVPRKGLLLTGPSGAGKSSVLDAIAAILVRPARLRLNAAAQGTDTGDRERSLATYVRGAHKRETDQATGEVATAFLRKGATWSAIALTFDDGAGTITTLLRAFHLRANSTAPADLKSIYILAGEPVDALQLKPYAENGIENRRVKAAFPSWEVYGADSYSGFAAKFRRRLGLGSEQAQLLLHKTQSAKNLTNLDTLFRDFMLDVPETFQLSDQAVEQFDELSLAHAAVVDARQQVEALSPLRALADQHSEAQAARQGVELQQRHLDTWLASRDIVINEARMAELGPQRDALAAELRLAERAKEAADQERDARQRAVDGSGGAQLSTLERLGATLRDGIAERRAERERFAGWAGELGLELPGSAAGLAGFVAAVQRVGSDVERRHAELRRASFDAQDAKRRAGERKQATEKELEALRKHRSNLDSRLLRVRELLAGRLQVPENRLPFVGELIQVRADEADWTGAIERVLGSFARTLVVPERHYLAAAEIIDSTFLGTRLVYEKVGQDGPVAPPTPGERSLPAKVELAEGPYQEWVAQRLAHRFDYLCVDHPREFAGAERAVTRNGQIKHSTSLHEKDDRRQITDRSRWVLGFTTEAKEAELERLIAEASGEIEAARRTLGRLDEEERQAGALREAHARLRDFEWARVDSESLEAKLEANDRELDELRRKHAGLARLEADLDRAREAVTQAERRRRQLAARHDQVAARLEELRDQTDALRRQVEHAEPVPDEAAANLNAQAEELSPDRLDQRLRDALGLAARAATEALGSAEAAIRRAMSVYKRGWPGRAADWAEAVDYLPEYLARLEDLTKDRLPEFEHRFFDLLQRQARNNISQLSMQVKGARREIRSRVDDVNKSLLLTEFSRGGYLQIEVKDRSLPQVEEFLATLGEITSGSMADVAGADSAEDRAAAEQRFLLMKRLLDRLGSSDPADRAWRDKCLDTRQHVSFQARVQDADGKQLDVFTGSGGRSGGERQKLVTFCLAAALRFQLSPAGARQPTYALVVIDEAFDKADHTFTQAGLEVFKTFGFQLLLATPLKMLQTIDDYVGGVVMVHKDAEDRSVIEELPFDGEVPAQAPADPLQEALV